ncbi:ribonuclease H-like domain-containing protein [Tanacetum coccineum]
MRWQSSQYTNKESMRSGKSNHAVHPIRRLCIMGVLKMEFFRVPIPVKQHQKQVHQHIEDDCASTMKKDCERRMMSKLEVFSQWHEDPQIHQLTLNHYADAQSMFILLKSSTFCGNECNNEDTKSFTESNNTPSIGFKSKCSDDLYNNFKIVEQKVKKSAGAINDDKNLAFVITSGSQLVHEDLEQLHDDDLKEMNLKWNMVLLSMRAIKFYRRTGRKIIIDGSNTAGYDKSKVECFNCHKMGHFARECRAPKSKDNRNWNQGSSSKALKIEDASEKAMYDIDGAVFDWSDWDSGEFRQT